MDSVAVLGHREFLESPVKNVFEKLLGRIEIFDREIEVDGLHVYTLMPKVDRDNCVVYLLLRVRDGQEAVNQADILAQYAFCVLK